MKRREIILLERSTKEIADLSDEEVDILQQNSKYIEVTLMKNGRRLLTTKNYIGYIVTRFHKIRIDSKIDKLNLQRMFSSAYDLRPFKKEDVEYLQQKK